MLDRLTSDRLRNQLRELPELCAYAWLDLAPSTTVRYGSIHTARLHAPAPVNEQVLSLLGPGDYLPDADEGLDQTGSMPVRAILSAWCQVLRGRPQPNISRAVAALLEHHTAACAAPWAVAYAEQIGDLHRQLQHHAHVRARTRTLQLACPKCTLYSLSQIDGDDVRCGTPRCGVVIPAADYDRRAATYADVMEA
jgi:hypothetical protein